MKVLNIIKDLANGGRFRILTPKTRTLLAMFVEGVENPRHRFEGHGRERLDVHFGLSRASFSVLPRVMLNDMPDDWQNQFVDLMNELDATFPNAPDEATEFKVMGVGEKGRVAKHPDCVTNYRRPDRAALDRWRGVQIRSLTEFVTAVRDCMREKWPSNDVWSFTDVVEYLNESRMKFGDPVYDWTHAGARTIADDIIEGAGE